MREHARPARTRNIRSGRDEPRTTRSSGGPSCVRRVGEMAQRNHPTRCTRCDLVGRRDLPSTLVRSGGTDEGGHGRGHGNGPLDPVRHPQWHDLAGPGHSRGAGGASAGGDNPQMGTGRQVAHLATRPPATHRQAERESTEGESVPLQLHQPRGLRCRRTDSPRRLLAIRTRRGTVLVWPIRSHSPSRT